MSLDSGGFVYPPLCGHLMRKRLWVSVDASRWGAKGVADVVRPDPRFPPFLHFFDTFGKATNMSKRNRRATRRAAAESLLAKRAARTPMQQLTELDWRLGTGQGAANERARLAATLAKITSTTQHLDRKAG